MVGVVHGRAQRARRAGEGGHQTQEQDVYTAAFQGGMLDIEQGWGTKATVAASRDYRTGLVMAPTASSASSNTSSTVRTPGLRCIPCRNGR